MRRKTAIAGLVGMLGVGSLQGCVNPEDEALLLSTLFGANAALETNPKKAIGYHALSNLAGTSAQWEHESRVAKEGRSQININTPSNPGTPSENYTRPGFSMPILSSDIIYLDKNKFNAFIFERDCVVKFYADWCEPSKKLAPYFERAAREIDYVSFGEIEIGNNRDLFSGFNVIGTPTIIFFDNGKEIDRMMGAVEFNEIKDRIENNYQAERD